ncbi:MAG: 2-amino-4-hydroxy-6-hydroxymethyldihydropteridine diphosphokinase [Candidatus Brocadiia bacterium]
MRVDAYLAVGSNVEPEANIPRALELLGRRVRLVATSTFYRTAPLERPRQPPFANGAWHIRTELGARELKFRLLRRVEARLGRVRTGDRFAPRPIDLDLALYGEAVIEEPDLRVPDPHIRRRAFLAVPLLELAPDIVLPDTGERLAELPAAASRDDLVPHEELTATLRRRLAAMGHSS